MIVRLLQVIREVQIPLVAVLLLIACFAKARQLRRATSPDSVLGPMTLFPARMRKPASIFVCVAEAVLGLGLIVTACGTRATGGVATATAARLAAGLLFLVATSTLIELRTVRPDVSCGCFGDFSTTPVSGRTIARSALLAAAILSTLDLRAVNVPHTRSAGLELLAIVCAELLLIGYLSPEIGASLIRMGYSEPCELRHVPSTRTLIALRRSKPWRRYGGLITSDVPVDIWRELCWRYVAYPSSYEGRPADLVFAVYLQYRRPVVHTALVDSGTGLPLPLPTGKGRAKPVPPPRAPSPPVEANGTRDVDKAATADALATADDAIATPDAAATADTARAAGVSAATAAAAEALATADDVAVALAATATSPAEAIAVGDGFAAATAIDAVAAAGDPDATLVDVLPRQP